MKFLKIENKILNTAQIEFVCVNQETIRADYQENDPFGESIKEVCGIRVYVVGAHENSYFVFESETIESFYEKLVAA